MNVLRVRHLENALSHWEKNNLLPDYPRMSLDSHLRSYYRAHKTKLSVADKDWLSETVKEFLRWRSLVQNFTQPPFTSSSLLRTFFGTESWRSYSNSKTLPDHVRLSMPEALCEQLQLSFGKEKTAKIANVWNERSPTFVRVNTLVDERERLIKHLASKGIIADKTTNSPIGLRMPRSEKVEGLEELKEHAFDIQDESCQMVGLHVGVKPGEKVLDFCSGSGGKSLVIGPALQSKGHLFLHDVNPKYLVQAKQKLRNAKIKNFTTIPPQSDQLRLLRNKMDWVLVDVPSTGSGQFRRYPERKWLYSAELLERTVSVQQEIFSAALKFLKPKTGKIVYATSSILPAENIEQVKFFCQTHKLYLSSEPVHSLPQSRGMDGFFSAILERQ